MCSPKEVCCFVCYKKFSKLVKSEQCKKCGDYKCPLCNSCLCDLTVGEQRVALSMMKTYEPVIRKNYDFSIHSKIEKKVKASLVR